MADGPKLVFAGPVVETGGRVDAPAQYDLPIAGFDGTRVPARRVEGRLEQRAYRLDGVRDTTLALMQPLRAQVLAAGYRVILDCETRGCGGFDFRFALDILPEPQMHVDLGDFRFLAAENAGGDVVSLLVSRALNQGFVQVTTVTAGGIAEAPASTPVPEPSGQAPDLIAAPPLPNLSLADPDRPEVIADPLVPGPPPDPLDLVAALESTGSAPLEDLVFASGKAALQDGDYASLVTLAAWLAAHPDLKVTLVGHTDATGTLAGNVALSRQRAEAVRTWLVETLGADGAQMDAQGAGYLAPRASNQTQEGRQKNRRVEVMLTSTPVKSP